MQSDRAFHRSPWPWGVPPESCRSRAAASLVSGNDELHDLRGAVSDLQAEDVSQALCVGHFLGVAPCPLSSRHVWTMSKANLGAHHLHIAASAVCGSPWSLSHNVFRHSKRHASSWVSASANGNDTP